MIIEDHITIDETARDILRNDILLHNSGKCDCREHEGRFYFCKAGEWLKGIVPSKHIVENYYHDLSKKRLTKSV